MRPRIHTWLVAIGTGFTPAGSVPFQPGPTIAKTWACVPWVRRLRCVTSLKKSVSAIM